MIDMEFVKENKGVIIFYLLLIMATLVIIQSNEKKLDIKNNYVYLSR